MEKPFEIFPYSIEKLIEIFAEKAGASQELIIDKIHTIYFQEYFQHLRTQTIIVENDYIDRDFLEDFSAYYVRCFADYKRKCTRLHFFKNKFGYDEYNAFLEKRHKALNNWLQENYLGFLVVKPLPQTVIGRTCLKTYSTEPEANRNFPIVREYEVNLFGCPLKVKTLAFQEQDTVLAACATSSLWSVFHGTGVLFHHRILSPVEITKAATRQLPIETRTFPNRGLSVEQMAHAIQDVDLEPFLVEIKNEEYILKSYIYAYLKFGIPVILGVNLYIVANNNSLKYIGKHAVAVTGYRMERERLASNNHEKFQLVSSRMSKIYAHDDQVGPFARMLFDGQKISLPETESKQALISMSTSWKVQGAEIGDIRAVPLILLIPLYHKIRIPLGNVYETEGVLNAILANLSENKKLPIGKFEWDISLTSVNKFKSELFSRGDGHNNFKHILLKSMPHFIWRATALNKGKFVIDLLFDATDIEQGRFFICAVEYDRDLFLIMREILKEKFFDEVLKRTSCWKIIQWFREN